MTSTISVAAVNDAPVIAGASATLAFSEGNGATINRLLPHHHRCRRLQHRIGHRLHLLWFPIRRRCPRLLQYLRNFTGSWNASTGVLTLTGSDSLANYKAALESVTYNNTSDNPNTADRTISWVVNDGDTDSSAVTSTISVAEVNDPPSITGDLAATVTEGDSYTITTTDLNVFDADDDAAGVTFSVSSLTNGTVLVNGSAATSFIGTQLAAGNVSFQHDGTETTSASFQVNVEDGNEDSSNPSNSAFNFTVTAS